MKKDGGGGSCASQFEDHDMGQKIGPSFFDYKLINRAYCSGKFISILNLNKIIVNIIMF